MTKIHIPAGLSFLSPEKIGAPPSGKCLGVSGNSKIQMRMLSHSEGLGNLILTKDVFWPHVYVCEGNRSFGTEAISYSSYEVSFWSFRTH